MLKDVLKLNALGKVGGGSGGGIFFVNTTMNYETMSIEGADKTFDEIEAAISGGLFPVAVLPLEGHNYCPIVGHMDGESVQFRLVLGATQVCVTCIPDGWQFSVEEMA